MRRDDDAPPPRSRRNARRSRRGRAVPLTLTALAAAVLGPVAPAGAQPAARPRAAVHPVVAAAQPAPLPGGRPRFVVSMLGGGFDAYWVRLAEYTFTAGSGGTGTVRQAYWMWHQAHFTGDARRNKVSTGFTTAGCRARCAVRTPRGFQPGAGPMGTLVGRYHVDRYGRFVVEWPGRRVEAWSVRTPAGAVARMTLHHTTLGGIAGDALGSTASFAAGATRDDVVAAGPLTGVQRVATWGDASPSPVVASRWNDVVGPLQRCRGAGAACLFRTDTGWRTALVVPGGPGRRAFWEHQLQGSDGDTGACFGPGGGHTVALLEALDDHGRFAGFVGAEASFNGRSRHNAVIGELLLT